MSKIISIHSFRGGTGKSNITASIATLLAAEGRRIGIVDTDIQSPGIHVIFGLKEQDALHAVRGLRSVIHGFAALEVAGGFGLPLDCDESFQRLLQIYIRGLQESAEKHWSSP